MMRRPLLAALAAALIAAAVFAWPLLFPPHLAFRDLDDPPGFRVLLLDGGATGVDPLAGLGAPAAPAEAQSAAGLCASLFGPAAGDRRVPVAAFFDVRCPYCRVLDPVLTRLDAEGAIRLVDRQWPILGEPSRLAAGAVLAAGEEGKAAALRARLMATSFVPTPGYIAAVAGELGLDPKRLAADLDDQAIDDTLAETAALAARLGFRGTPSLVVGRTLVTGEVPERTLRALVADEAKRPAC